MLPTDDEFTTKHNAYIFKPVWVAAVLLSTELKVYCYDLPLRMQSSNDNKPRHCYLNLEKEKAEYL